MRQTPEAEQLRAAVRFGGTGVSAKVANRTHRVVRERARSMRARRDKVRSLWVPLLVCAALLPALCAAVWNLLDQYQAVPSGIPDASQQLLVLMMWSLPLSGALLAWVWFRRGSGSREDESTR